MKFFPCYIFSFLQELSAERDSLTRFYDKGVDILEDHVHVRSSIDKTSDFDSERRVFEYEMLLEEGSSEGSGTTETFSTTEMKTSTTASTTTAMTQTISPALNQYKITANDLGTGFFYSTK